MSTRYPTEVANPSPLEVVNSATFGPAVRRAFHDMGRVDVTPYAIPWSGIDVPLVSDLPIKPNDRAEVNYLATASATTAAVVWRFVYQQGTNKWHFIGGPPLVSVQSTGESSTAGTHTTYQDLGDGAFYVTAPLAGVYDVAFGAYVTGGTANSAYISVKYGTAEANDTDGILATVAAGTWAVLAHEPQPLSVTADATALTLRFRGVANLAMTYGRRHLRITPRMVDA